MNAKFFILLSGIFILAGAAFSTPALADGMPFQKETTIPAAPAAASPAPINPIASPPADIKTEAPFPPLPVPQNRVVEVQQEDPSFFGLSIGTYGALSHGTATALSLEWQPTVRVIGVLQPIFGGMITTKATALAYAGLGVPFRLKSDNHFMIMPSAALGLYQKGGGYNLRSVTVLRLGAEMAYQFEDKSRIGLNFHILSNGQGFGEKTRSEIIGLSYTRPLILTLPPPRPPGQTPFPLP